MESSNDTKEEITEMVNFSSEPHMDQDLNQNFNIKSLSLKNKSPKHKKTNSLIDLVINHSQEIINKSTSSSLPIDQVGLLESVYKQRSTADIVSLNKESKRNKYYHSIKTFFVYLLYGFLGGVIINACTQSEIVNMDMIFNVLISPILYFHSPKNILSKINKKDFIIYYSIPYVLGLCFRFLDMIPVLSSFVLNPEHFKTTGQIVLLIILCLLFLFISVYYIFISAEPLINSILLGLEFSLTIGALYCYNSIGGNIHIHHYFVGLVLMMISRNYHSKIVIIIHAFAYGVYIEGLSRWGIGSLFWK